MHASFSTLAAICLATFGQAPAADPPTAETSTAEPAQAQIEAAIKQLADEQFEVREKATQLLIQAGEAARSAAESAAKSTDPEVALRAKIVLRRLNSGIGPGTPPAVVALIEEFAAADRNRKLTIIHRLAEPSEFQAIWTVIAREPDASQRTTLEGSFRSRVTALVGQHFRGQKHDDAEALLLATANEPRSEAALATLRLLTGRLAARIDELTKELAGKPSPLGQKRLALMHRAAGDLPQARQVAESLKEQELSLWLAAEAGDWPAALRINRSLYEGQEPNTEQLAFTLLLSYYSQDDKSLAEAKKLLLKRAADKPADNWPVAEALLVAEQIDEGIALLEQGVPAAAFYLHWYRTHFEKAFALAKVGEGATLDKAWYDALPDGNLAATGMSIKRYYYARDIAGCLNYVGRRDDARQVAELMRQSIQNEPPGSQAWAALVSTDLRLGMREQALQDAARGLAVPADAPRRRPGASISFNSNVLTELYGQDMVTPLYAIWPNLLAACGDDPLAALRRLEPLCYRPALARLSFDERREQLRELVSLRALADRFRHGEMLRSMGWLAYKSGDEDFAFRCRRQATLIFRGDENYARQLLGGEAYRDEDWPAAVHWLRQYADSGAANSSLQEQLTIALDKLNRPEEAGKYRELAARFRIEPSAHAMYGTNLLKHGLKSQAAEQLRLAAQLLPPGDGATINAVNSLGNAIYETTPAAATPLWQLNMLGTLRGTNNMPLDTYIKNLVVIHRVQARDLIAQGKFPEALAHCFQELDAMPGNVAVIEQLVPVLEAQGQRPLSDELFERSFATYAAFCEKYPQSTAHRNVLARTAARCNRRLDEALARINEALVINAQAIGDERPDLHATLAEVQLARGDREAAVAAAEEGLKIQPAHEACEKVLAKARGEATPAAAETE